MRVLGLFMILPVFSIYAEQLPQVTPLLVGIAIGIYGLTQAMLQIPFGMLSDRFGRKPIITIGLSLFALGSVVAAMSTTIVGIIIGRALQGGGAIASAALALTADLTQEEHRTKAMAILGMSIGMSFTIALILGPVFNQWIGVSGIFWLTALFAIIAIGILYLIVPKPLVSRLHRDAEPVPAQFKRILADQQLLRLDIGVFLLHWFMTSLFIELPLVLKTQLAVEHHWYLYLPILIGSVMIAIPFIIIAEKYRALKSIFSGAIVVLALSQVGFAFLHDSWFGIVFMLFLFFVAFNLLEASLPSLISKVAPVDSKGTAMGIYSSCQFLGVFVGGAVGGWLHQHYQMNTIFMFYSGLALIWFMLAVTMRSPSHLSSYLLKIAPLNEQQARQLTQQLNQIEGVTETIIILEEEVAYLRIDRKKVDFATLEKFSVTN
jgi:MFS family permease